MAYDRHLLCRKQLWDVLTSRGGQPTHQLRPQCAVRVPFGPRDDDVLDLRGISVVQLRDDVKEFSCFAADDGQEKLRLGLGEPHSRPLCSEWRESHGHC
jgi:hypothetical protein